VLRKQLSSTTHACTGNSQYPASEAIPSVNAFNADTADQQAILDFLRDL